MNAKRVKAIRLRRTLEDVASFLADAERAARAAGNVEAVSRVERLLRDVRAVELEPRGAAFWEPKQEVVKGTDGTWLSVRYLEQNRGWWWSASRRGMADTREQARLEAERAAGYHDD